jgi:hypothetical protein
MFFSFSWKSQLIIISSAFPAPTEFSVRSVRNVGSNSYHRSFQLEIHPEHIPPFLQMTILHSKRLLQQTYDLEYFSLQMIHASRALLHAIVSLAEAFQRFKPKLRAVGRNERLDEASEDFLLVAPLLAEKLDK